ncbi:DUF2500 domain-containing protein [Gottfriedia solisilvae]|uniref:DUF2500 domain-containing protein n=1 Tax=Gottfriedia solisilvae TaxID=1516104 RepID=UPI003D2EC9AB
MFGFDTDLDAFKIIAFVFPILFIFVFASIFLTLLKVLKQWNYNNKQPKITVPATLITKSTKVIQHKRNQYIMQSPTSYSLTFEVESGESIELSVDGLTYGKFIENETGILTYQGNKLIHFER